MSLVVVTLTLVCNISPAVAQAGSFVEILALKSDPAGKKVEIPWQQVVGLPHSQVDQKAEFSMTKLASLKDIIDAKKDSLEEPTEEQKEAIRNCEEATEKLQQRSSSPDVESFQADEPSSRQEGLLNKLNKGVPLSSESIEFDEEWVPVDGVDLRSNGIASDMIPSVVPIFLETKAAVPVYSAPAGVVENTVGNRVIQMTPIYPAAGQGFVYDRIDVYTVPPIYLPPVRVVPVAEATTPTPRPPFVEKSREAGAKIKEG